MDYWYVHREHEWFIGMCTGNMSVAERNGSVESNESSSPEDSHQGTPTDAPQRPPDAPMQVPQISLPAGTIPPLAPDFDFNEFFKIDNIPGLGLEVSVVMLTRFLLWLTDNQANLFLVAGGTSVFVPFVCCTCYSRLV